MVSPIKYTRDDLTWLAAHYPYLRNHLLDCETDTEFQDRAMQMGLRPAYWDDEPQAHEVKIQTPKHHRKRISLHEVKRTLRGSRLARVTGATVKRLQFHFLSFSKPGKRQPGQEISE
jgi:hypothetical protein